jgi:hypothetical protein
MHLWREHERSADAPDPSGLALLPAGTLAGLGVDELIARFKALAIAKDEADGIVACQRLACQLDDVVGELERRDAQRVLLALYADPDVRVRAEAADATFMLAPALAHDRLLAIDEPEWSPPVRAGPRRSPLRGMTTEQLVDRFLTLALDQDEALLQDKTARFNRLYGLLQAVVVDLVARDQLPALLALLDHPNPQVRLKAATAVHGVAPAAARRALQRIVDADDYPQAPDAAGMLRPLDQGGHEPG